MKADARGSLPLKVAALFLAALLFCGALYSGFAVAYLYSGGAYDGAGSYYRTAVCASVAADQAESLYYLWTGDPAGTDLTAYDGGGSTFGFTLTPDDGTPVSLHVPESPAYTSVHVFEQASVTVFLAPGTPADGPFAFSQRLYERLLPQKNDLLFVAALCLVAEAVTVVFLCCAAGHRRGETQVLPNYLDRLPFDLWLAIAAAGCALLALPIESLPGVSGFPPPWLLLIGVCLLGMFLLALATLLTFATRVKLGKWWRNTIVCKVLRLFWLLFRGLGRALAAGFRALPTLWRTILTFCAFALAQTLMTLSGQWSGGAVLLLLLMDAAMLWLLCRYTLALRKLAEGGARLAAGDADCRVELAKMPPALRAHGEHLNSIGDGISIAVEREMKSERMKTELITNVSHDIKTPLTSILNYVDLLQKDPTDEQRAEYLAVLDRQARRLKKLTEDLVEASKAATGNLTVELERTDLCELLRQAAGEYEERLGQNRLTPVVTAPETPVPVMADGQLLWRVIDNLLSNACKYAQEGTRVYLDVRRIEDRAVLTVRNVSRQQLNIDPDELLERFVRGDSARNTEGSGLGLNIARSLTELQHGALTLAIDGDLFKATLSFPALTEDAA